MAGGPCTDLQSRLPAFLESPSVTVDALPRLVPSCAVAVHVPRGLYSPSIVSGCSSHAGTRSLNRDKLNTRSLWSSSGMAYGPTHRASCLSL